MSISYVIVVSEKTCFMFWKLDMMMSMLKNQNRIRPQIKNHLLYNHNLHYLTRRVPRVAGGMIYFIVYLGWLWSYMTEKNEVQISQSLAPFPTMVFKVIQGHWMPGTLKRPYTCQFSTYAVFDHLDCAEHSAEHVKTLYGDVCPSKETLKGILYSWK